MLQQGAATARDPFFRPVLGTVGFDSPRRRTVVLCRVIEAVRLWICHTGRHAAKVDQIRANPRVNGHFYHTDEEVQLRLSGQSSDRRQTAVRRFLKLKNSPVIRIVYN